MTTGSITQVKKMKSSKSSHPFALLPLVLSMCVIVVASNVLVQFPVMHTVGSLNLADLLTWGAFTYPTAFLITDLTNRIYGPARARRIVFFGFVLAVVCSATLPKILFYIGFFPFELSIARLTRIAIASGSAFLIAQLLDVVLFDWMRAHIWWKPPLISSIAGSVVDTVLFFSLAFAARFVFLGENDDFALQSIPFLTTMNWEAPRWLSWAVGDFGVKIFVGLAMLLPYGVLLGRIRPSQSNTA